MYKLLILAMVIFGVSFSTVSNATDNSSDTRAKIFSKMDTDGDGKISLDEFLAKHKIRFEIKDVDGDGYLTEDEMKPKFQGGMMGKGGKGKGMGRGGDRPSDMPEPAEDME